ncbi:MAG: chorismate synthase [Lachnospirales bacterium]
MSSIIGKKLQLSVFGESHGSVVGATIHGLPAGFKIDRDYINNELVKRKAKGGFSTPRIENDEIEIVSGVFEEYTTGMPLTVIIRNTNFDIKEYNQMKDIPRPSHADYVANIKYDGFNDYRGGGHFSARLTAPMVAVSAICKKILAEKGINVFSHIKSIGPVVSSDYLTSNKTTVLDEVFPVLNESVRDRFFDELIRVKNSGDSVGGSVQTIVRGLPVGFGSPIFDTIEGDISKMIFSIPGVKALEFGRGIEMSRSIGSVFNDAYTFDGKIKLTSNNCGGVNGGISNGADIVFTTYFKPTPSIEREQLSVNLKTNERTRLRITGKHDPCIAVRGVHVVTNLTAFQVLDIYLHEKEK